MRVLGQARFIFLPTVIRGGRGGWMKRFKVQTRNKTQPQNLGLPALPPQLYNKLRCEDSGNVSGQSMDSKWMLQRAATFSLPAGSACASLKRFAMEGEESSTQQ